MRLVIATLLALAALSGVAWAGDRHCLSGELCKIMEETGRGRTTDAGGPDPKMVCFSVLVQDARAATIAIVRYGDGRPEYVQKYKKDALLRFSGTFAERHRNRRLPAFCIEDWKLRGAISILVCDTDKRGSVTLKEPEIRRLLTERTIPQHDPACLLGSEACNKEERAGK